MTTTCTIIRDGRCDTYGRPLLVGQEYAGPDDFVSSLRSTGFAAPEDGATEEPVIPGITQWDIVPSSSTNTTSKLFVHPITQAGHLQLGERQIFVPIGGEDNYFGTFFGKMAKAHTVESITDTGIFRPGLFSWHGSATKSGTWTLSVAGVATGAFQATGIVQSSAAGDSCSISVTGDALAVRFLMTTNGGYGIVAIDGDYTRATKLPNFTAADYAADRCRESDIGKRYISCYAAAPYNECLCIADGLAKSSHVVTVVVTGKKPAASGGARVYIEGFGGANGDTIGTANVHMIPTRWINHNATGSWNAMCYVPYWAPTGSVDYQFLGEVHGDNVQSKEVSTSGPTVYVDVTDQTAQATGTYTSGTIIRIDHVSTLAHKVNTAAAVATKTRRYTFTAQRKHMVMCDCKIEWTTSGVISVEYPAMLPVGRYVNSILGMEQKDYTTAWAGHTSIPFTDTNDGSQVFVSTDIKRAIAVGDEIQAWTEIVSEQTDGCEMYRSYGVMYQDRTTNDDKLYIIGATGPQPFASGEVRRFIIGWGAELL